MNKLYCFGNDNSIHLQQTKQYKSTVDSRVFHRSSQISPSFRQTKQKKLDKRFSLNLYSNASSLCFAGESLFCTKCKVFLPLYWLMHSNQIQLDMYFKSDYFLSSFWAQPFLHSKQTHPETDFYVINFTQ